MKLRRPAFVATFCLLPLLVLFAVERQFPQFILSEARARTSSPEGPTPQDVLSANVTENEITTLLAVGDIADCGKQSSFANLFLDTATLLGFPIAFQPETALANKTAALASDRPTVPILALGDTVYSHGRPVEYAKCFEPTWGALKSRLLPTPGNHEYKTPGAFGYYDYFGAQAGPDRRGWYAVDAPGWLILSLNSEVDAEPGSDQSTWLANQLENSDAACILAFFHKPAHSLSERGGRENAVHLFRQLHAGGATLVLNGHNHFYERTKPIDGSGAHDPDTGTVAFTVGTGGKVYSERPVIATTEATTFGQVGILELELKPGEYGWSYIDAESGVSVDQGLASCNPVIGRLP